MKIRIPSRLMAVWCWAAMAVFGAARAEVIVNNLNQPTGNYFGPIGGDSTTNDFLIGQQITLPPAATPYQLNKVTLLLSASGGGGNVAVSVWGVDANNHPTNEISLIATQLVANAGNIDFVATTNIVLSPGIYFVVAAPANPTNNTRVEWAYAANTNWTGPGALGGYVDTSEGNWVYTPETNFPQQISVDVTPVNANVSIGRSNQITALSWPAALAGFVAESTTNLNAAAWQPLTNRISFVGGVNRATNAWGDASRFFRLRQSWVAGNLSQPVSTWDGPLGNDANQNDFLIGQEFTLPAGIFTINKVTLGLNPAYGTANVTASLWQAGPDNNPTNRVGTIASAFVPFEGPIDFVPTTPLVLAGGHYYVVAGPTSAADNGLVGWDWTVSTSWTGFGALGNIASNDSGVWVNSSLELGPYLIQIQATPKQ